MVTAETKLPAHYFDDEETDGSKIFPMVLDNPTFYDIQEERKLAKFNKGVVLVIGSAGAGKDLFIVSTCYENKRFYNRHILLDFKPRRLFGEYTFFDPVVMSKEIDKLAKSASLDLGNPDEELTKQQELALQNTTEQWLEEHTSLLQESVLYLSELRRYCHNRNPHNRVNKAIGALCTQWRHLDMLIIGSHIQQHEIDKWTFGNLENRGNLTHFARCSWMMTRLNTTQVSVSPYVALTEFGNFDLHLQSEIVRVDGGVPRRFLTKPDTIYNATPLGSQLLRNDGAGLPGYEILDFLDRQGATEAETIAQSFGAKQSAVDDILFSLVEQGYAKGNRFFDLWNSKNKVNLKPEMRRG